MNSLGRVITENRAIQDKIIDVVADYDIEFAAELDDLVEHKIKADDLDLNRLHISFEQPFDSLEDYFMLFLDGKTIAKYWIERNLESLKAEIHFEKI